MAIKHESRADEKYLRPKRAEKKFKLAKDLRQTLYLYGITGSGKTAFVKDMLRPGSFRYYSAEETNPEQLEIPEILENQKCQILVIDNLQQIQGESRRIAYTKQLRALLARKDVWLILISRCRIPQWLMPLHMENAFLIIGEEDFQFDRIGQDAYFEKWNLNLSPKLSDQIWDLAHGNPLFLRFMALAGGDMQQAIHNLWEYLFHVYDQWDSEVQTFVMEMSVVERFDAGMAQVVTGRNDVQRILKKAMETGNFFKETDGVYEYNFIFRDCIQAYLERKFDRDQIARIYYNAGHMYETYGDIPNALRMHEAGGDKKSIFRLLMANARRNPASGHYFELRRYYLLLSEETICTSPVLMAGMSMLQSILMNLEESERWYQLLADFASNRENNARQEAKNWLLYLDIALPHKGTIQMIELLKYAGRLLKNGKAILPELSVTSNLPSLMNGGKDFCEWSKHDQELAASIGKLVEFVLGKYGKGLVSVALAESYFEKGLDICEIISLAEKGRMQAEAGGKTELVFVAVGILVWLSVINGRGEDAQDILESFRQSIEKHAPQLIPNLCALQCRIFLYQGKTHKILNWMKTAPDENQDFCTLERLRYLTKIRCYIQFGKYDKAYCLLQKMLYFSEVHQRTYISMEAKLLLAIVQYRMKEKTWQETLQEVISQAENYHFVRLFTREGGAVLKLFKSEDADFQWQNESYRKQVLRECEKMKKFYPAYLKEKIDGDIILSKNALNILRLQAEGYQNNQIAKLLGITSNTIKYHSKETYRKLGVSSKTAAVNEAKNRGLI